MKATTSRPSADPPTVGVLGVVRFVAELLMLGSLGYVGARFGDGPLASLALALLLPAAAAAVWGAFIAPRAVHRLRDRLRLAVEVGLFGATAVGLVSVGATVVAGVLTVAYCASASHGRDATEGSAS